MSKHYREKPALVYSLKDNKTQYRPLSLGDQQQEEEATTCLPEYCLNVFCLCQVLLLNLGQRDKGKKHSSPHQNKSLPHCYNSKVHLAC